MRIRMAGPFAAAALAIAATVGQPAALAGEPPSAATAYAPAPPEAAAGASQADAAEAPAIRTMAAATTASPAPAATWTRKPVVGLQVGHWQAELLPEEAADLRANGGAERDGYREVDANYAVTQAAAGLLRAAGVKVDVLPATVPPGYKADAFVAVHADQDMGEHARGYKVAASAVSKAKAESKQLAADVGADYSAETELPQDVRPTAITADMRWYFAFNFTYYKHAVAPSTPAAIVELGFITDPDDRAVLFEHPEIAGQGLAGGIMRFLQAEPGLVRTQTG